MYMRIACYPSIHRSIHVSLYVSVHRSLSLSLNVHVLFIEQGCALGTPNTVDRTNNCSPTCKQCVGTVHQEWPFRHPGGSRRQVLLDPLVTAGNLVQLFIQLDTVHGFFPVLIGAKVPHL